MASELDFRRGARLVGVFTGIVEGLGEVGGKEELGDSARLVIRGPVVTSDAGHGDSIAVNGVCLTVVEVLPDGAFSADVMGETLIRSTLGVRRPGDPVNLERATRLGGRLGGHLVQGHVDGMGSIVDRVPGAQWETVRFSLPDLDVFAIDANAGTPSQVQSWSGVGTTIFNMVASPTTPGKFYVSNTEARNEVRFEGPGGGGSTVRGHLHEARITVLDGPTAIPRALNKHIDYGTVPSLAGTKDKSLAIPTGMAVSNDGAILYVAAFGSSKIGIFNTSASQKTAQKPSIGRIVPGIGAVNYLGFVVAAYLTK